jgi:hypothetical protein
MTVITCEHYCSQVHWILYFPGILSQMAGNSTVCNLYNRNVYCELKNVIHIFGHCSFKLVTPRRLCVLSIKELNVNDPYFPQKKNAILIFIFINTAMVNHVLGKLIEFKIFLDTFDWNALLSLQCWDSFFRIKMQDWYASTNDNNCKG